MATSRQPTKAATQKVGEYNLVPSFPGYNARTDKTALPPGTLIPGSQNVLIKTSGRVAAIAGYTLDGAGSSTADSGILSNFDFHTFKSDTRNLRAGFLTTAGNNGKLQYRFVTSDGVVHWVDLATGLTNVRLSFCEYWDTTALVKQCLWVDGTSNVFAWNGAVTTIASATAPVAGVIVTIATAPTAAGTGYAVGDILTLAGGTLGSVKVTAIGGGGSVTSVSLYEPGTGGYSVASGIGTSGGTGTGCTVQVTAVASRSSITKQGTTTWAQEGFLQGSGGSITLGGVAGAYSGQGVSTVLMGVTGDFSGNAAGSIVHQGPVTKALSSMTAILAAFSPTVIGCGRTNQVYLGSSSSNSLYISKVNDYTNYTFSTPTRLVGEGNLIPLDSPPTAFVPLEDRTDTSAYDLYISEGSDRWAVIKATLSADLTAEKQEHIRLQVAPLQGAKSGRLVGKMKNHIMFVGNDNVANFLGYQSFQNIPEMVDFSWPIIDDMGGYDLTDGSIYYNRNYIYIALPKHGIIRVFNMTDQTKETTQSPYHAVEDVDPSQPWFWEAPITYPLSGFYWTPDKGLCGHSYSSSESYQLFTGGSLNGQNIDAKAVFAFEDYGDRTQSKGSDELWVEGYIKQNTKLQATVTGDLDAFATGQIVTIDGSDNSIVAYGAGGHALGKNALGSQPLGGAATNVSTLPAWFHVAKTYPEIPSYVEGISFETNGIDLGWELLTFGTNAKFTTEGNNMITQ